MITEIILLLCFITTCLASYNLYKTLKNEAEIKAKEVEKEIKTGDV